MTGDERQQAVDALAAVERQQEDLRRRTRVPWWYYLAMFLFSAALTAVNDFTGTGGAKAESALILVALLVVLGVVFISRKTPLARVRGAERRQEFVPRVFLAVAVLGAAGAWLLGQYGTGLAQGIGDGLGIGRYPYTVLGVLYGAAFTALFALSQAMTAAHDRRAAR